MPSDTRRSPRPSWWWALAGLGGAIALAWVAGSTGGGIAAAPPPSIDLPGEVAVPSTDLAGLDLIEDAEAFWRAIGAGDAAAVRGMLDPEARLPIIHYAEFAAAFDAGFITDSCRPVAANVVRCLLGAENAELVDLYRAGTATTAYVESASITFSDRGIESFQLPDVINRASIRMLAHATETLGTPAACDRTNYDAIDLPPFNTSMAQTAECAQELLPFLPGAIAAQVP